MPSIPLKEEEDRKNTQAKSISEEKEALVK